MLRVTPKQKQTTELPEAGSVAEWVGHRPCEGKSWAQSPHGDACLEMSEDRHEVLLMQMSCEESGRGQWPSLSASAASGARLSWPQL